MRVPRKHGMEFRPYYLAREWIRAGHEVHMLAADYSHLRQINPTIHSKVADELLDGITYTWCKTPPYEGNGVSRVKNIFTFLWRAWRQSGRYQNDFRPDVVIASSTYPLDTLLAARIAKKTGAKFLYEVHDLWPLTPVEVGGMSPKHPFIRLLQWAEDYGYRTADKVVSMLPCAKAYMMEHGMAADKYVVIPNGVVVSEWTSQTQTIPALHDLQITALREQGHFLIGYAGGHGLANALDVLLDAMVALKELPVSVVLVGEGPDKAKLIEEAKAKGLRNVHFLSGIPKGAVPDFLSKLDALYIGWRQLPIYRFGINPNKLFDYMMSAKPVIHSVTAGNDMVAEAECGICVPAEDVPAIANAIRQMMNTPPAQRERMGAAGKRFVLEKHDYEILAARFVAAMK